MFPVLKIFNFSISMYSLCSIIAIITSFLCSIYISKYYRIKKNYIFYGYVYIVIGILIGAKSYYILTHINNSYELKIETLMSGFSFFGAFLGAFISIYFFSKDLKVRYNIFFEILIPPLILFYGISKIGCFCAGCCYGLPYNEIQLFNLVPYIGSKQNLFPIQIIESIFYILCFGFIFSLYKNYNKTNKILGYTLLLLGIGKFCFQFFRGCNDEIMIFNISISQYLSFILIIIGIIYMKKYK